MRRWPAATEAPEGESGLTCCCDFWGGDLSAAMANPQAQKEKRGQTREIEKRENTTKPERLGRKQQCASSVARGRLDTVGTPNASDAEMQKLSNGPCRVEDPSWEGCRWLVSSTIRRVSEEGERENEKMEKGRKGAGGQDCRPKKD